MQLHLQKCDLSHLDEIVQLSRKTFKDAFETENDPVDFSNYMDSAFHKDVISAQIQNNDSCFYFVKANSTTVGYFKLNENFAQTDLKLAHSVELERIYILERFQGEGIGSWMLDKIKQMGFNKGKRFLWLGVWEKNQRAIRFYERLGFIKFGTHPYFIGKDQQTDWLMRLDLTNLNPE